MWLIKCDLQAVCVRKLYFFLIEHIFLNFKMIIFIVWLELIFLPVYSGTLIDVLIFYSDIFIIDVYKSTVRFSGLLSADYSRKKFKKLTFKIFNKINSQFQTHHLVLCIKSNILPFQTFGLLIIFYEPLNDLIDDKPYEVFLIQLSVLFHKFQ